MYFIKGQKRKIENVNSEENLRFTKFKALLA